MLRLKKNAMLLSSGGGFMYTIKILTKMAVCTALTAVAIASCSSAAFAQHRRHGGGYEGNGGYNGGYYQAPPLRRDNYCGSCRQNYSDGSYYVGELLNGVRHGHGDYFFPNGATYSGGWFNNAKHGDAQMSLPNGAVVNQRWNMDTLISQNVVVAGRQPQQAPQQQAQQQQQ